MTPSHDPWEVMPVRIVGIRQEISAVATYDLELMSDHRYEFQPGQFNMIYVPGVGEAAISLSGAIGRVLHHTIREHGNVTHALAQLKIGATLGLRGPFGSSWPMKECEGKDIILVAGGIGLPPVRPVIAEVMQLLSKYGKLSVLHGARCPGGLLYTYAYDDWRRNGVNVETIVDQPDASWQGAVGVITQLLDRCAIPLPANTIVMTCGPEIMLKYVAKAAMARGIPSENIHISMERHMNCGFGHCGHCQWGPMFTCKEGPVYRYDRVASLLPVEGR